MTVKEFAFPLPYIPPALAPVVLFFIVSLTKLLQKREMRKDIVIELSYKGFSRASDYS